MGSGTLGTHSKMLSIQTMSISKIIPLSTIPQKKNIKNRLYSTPSTISIVGTSKLFNHNINTFVDQVLSNDYISGSFREIYVLGLGPSCDKIPCISHEKSVRYIAHHRSVFVHLSNPLLPASDRHLSSFYRP
jgi:hypothetical protein